MLAKFKAALSGGANKMSGRTDFLEAVCAAAALVAAADGEVEDSEIDATAKAVAANKVLAVAFSAREIESVMGTMLDRANGGRVGRMGLFKEIEEIASSAEDAEVTLLTAIDIAEADGEIDDDEVKVMEKIASKLGLKLSDFMD